jgi:hypothetical protein
MSNISPGEPCFKYLDIATFLAGSSHEFDWYVWDTW